MLYIYGIIDGSEIRATVPLGHHRSCVTALPVGGLAAAVSDAALPDIAASVENVWRHDRVLDALMARHAVLPMRFGSVSTRDRLAAVLAPRRPELRRALERVSGKVEIAVRVLSSLPATSTAVRARPGDDDNRPPGTAYLRSRMADRSPIEPACARRRAAAVSILARLEALSAAALWDRAGAWTLPVEASFLVAREGLREFVDAAAALASRDRAVALNCTGPWAPYSFVADIASGP